MTLAHGPAPRDRAVLARAAEEQSLEGELPPLAESIRSDRAQEMFAARRRVEVHVDPPVEHRRGRGNVRALRAADRRRAEGRVVEEQLDVHDLLRAGHPAVDLRAA